MTLISTSDPMPLDKVSCASEVFDDIRRTRLMQICVAAALGLAVLLLVAKGITLILISMGLGSILCAFVFAFQRRVQTSAYIMLSALCVMLFSLAYTGAGMFDIAVLGYPSLLIFAAILGGIGLFISVLLFVISLCIVLTSLTINGIITPHVPVLSWIHLIFILVIFIVTGFSVFVLVRDIKRLTVSLQTENQEVQRSRKKIQHLARHDSLTNLPNRFYGERLFARAFAQCHQSQCNLALIFIDLDNFKPVNDALGHAAGDQLLQQLAKQLRAVLKPDQHLIRFGSDEFLVLQPYAQAPSEINALTDILIRQCSSVFTIMHTQIVLSASLGIACAPKDGTDFNQLCRKADIAMYQAKQNGKNTSYFYNSQLDRNSNDKFNLLQRLRPSLEAREFELYYQPMVTIASGEVTTVEALLRWPQSDGTFIPPDSFIPLAENNGFISELGHWVIQEACLFCARQRALGRPDLRVAVNVSAIQFKDRQLVGNIENALTIAKLPPHALELELTESVLINETDQIQQQLTTLSQMGITIAIDDFGTGYSNLGYLRDFCASKLKIDRAFIRSLCRKDEDDSLVQAIINMALSLGMKTVAEGIEDKQTLMHLQKLGCDYGQGFYWSKPVAQSDIDKTCRLIENPPQ